MFLFRGGLSRSGLCLLTSSARGQAARFLSSGSTSSETPNAGYEREKYEQRSKSNESVEQKRARLVYQSRKRGTLENDLLLSTFAHKYLKAMTVEQLTEYDFLINATSNEWDIYYWATGAKPVPTEFDNSVMNLFAEHVRNEEREQRFKQPPL